MGVLANSYKDPATGFAYIKKNLQNLCIHL